jgi:hypothetical protein
MYFCHYKVFQLFDYPAKLPTPITPPKDVVDKCVMASANHFKINPLVIRSILAVEGGKIGTLSRNDNGTFDMGLMQINTIHLPDIKNRFPSVGWKELTYNPCINIGIGTWILDQRLKETSRFWEGVGNYHSKSPKYRTIYLQKIAVAYKSQLSHKN